MSALHVPCYERGSATRSLSGWRRGPVRAATALFPFLCFFILLLATVSCAGDDGDPTGPEPTTGALEVATATTGSDPDADGYTVTVGGTQSRSIGPNASVTFTGLAADVHDVELSGLATNCALVGENPRTVTVVGGATATTAFEVSCTQITGTIEVTTSTVGERPDPDGYAVTLDGSESQPIDPTGTATFTEVVPGEHELELSGVADNCQVEGATRRSVTVVGDAMAAASFAVSCRIDRIVFHSDRSENFDVWVMEADGSNPINLTQDAGGREDFSARWSPDGTRLAFEAFEGGGNEDIWVMDADGSNQTNLTNSPETRDREVRWSPDGTRIAFRRDGSTDSDIWVMDADGSTPVNLTADVDFNSDPQWSPDGTRIAFRSFESGNGDIWVVGADGSNPMNLTNHAASDRDPRWSPDGTRIAFARLPAGESRDIWVMDADGSNAIQLTDAPGDDLKPRWSPDGTRIAFRNSRATNHDIRVMEADGSNPISLTSSGTAFDPRWSPDGTRIAFRSRSITDSDIWVMGADGSNPTNLTENPADDLNPAWQP